MTRDLCAQYAVEQFDAGLNCAEATFAAAMRYMGMEDDYKLRLATPFGAGFGRAQLTCGILSGALMAIGAACGRDGADGDREKPYAAARRYAEAFRGMANAADCRAIVGIDLMDPAQNATYRQPGGPHFARCGPLMKKAVMELCALLDDVRADG